MAKIRKRLIKPFEGVEKWLQVEPSLERREDGYVIERRGGRAPRPNMGSFTFCIDRKVHSDFSVMAKKLGTNKSAVANALFKQWMCENRN